MLKQSRLLVKKSNTLGSEFKIRPSLTYKQKKADAVLLSSIIMNRNGFSRKTSMTQMNVSQNKYTTA